MNGEELVKVDDIVLYVDAELVAHIAQVKRLNEDGTVAEMAIDNSSWTVLNVPHKSTGVKPGEAYWEYAIVNEFDGGIYVADVPADTFAWTDNTFANVSHGIYVSDEVHTMKLPSKETAPKRKAKK